MWSWFPDDVSSLFSQQQLLLEELQRQRSLSAERVKEADELQSQIEVSFLLPSIL